ncbi:hypothetical protein [Prosthecobacter fluviatilis]|uniref:Uncharacterized protein n=1 Tax=Prosthecobacter fluviatilis TaxID=445931 RepID=A0ABW0KMF4_9BACT
MNRPFLSFCMAFCLTSLSCERHTELRREIAALDARIKKDKADTLQYEQDIAALGGKEALPRISQQAQETEDQVRPLEFVNAPRERKLSAIESGFAMLKPAAEAYKAANLK